MAAGDFSASNNVMLKLNNRYFLIRHGQALSNIRRVISCWSEKVPLALTKKGAKQIERTAKKLKKSKIDLIISSDILRAKQSAEIISKELKVKLRYDKRLREYNVGVLNGAPLYELKNYFKSLEERFFVKPKAGETYKEIGERTYSFLKEQEKKYKGKNIIIVSHQVPLSILLGRMDNLSDKEIIKKYFNSLRIKNAQIKELK